MLDLNQNLYKEEFSYSETKELRDSNRPRTRGDVNTSDEISGIEVRLSKAVVLDNKTTPVWPFPGLAKVYFMNIVISDISADQVDLTLDGFEKVDDNHILAVDRTLFFWKKTNKSAKSPSQIHIMSSLIKSKKDLRKTADILASVKEDKAYKDLTAELGTLLKNTASVTNISNVVLQVAGIVGGFLGKVDDKPLLTRFQSFTDIAGDFNPLGKTVSPFSNKYAELDFAIYIRDKERADQ